ncbi:protein kinase domain-containing protein [Yinghuangia seranimata]|uniref:protein kinase domain-containing protein n=1 Tax=Yinghuangia seranimata TaxID=408067 RepID=UPI00248BFC6A|nr:protein kinase [Yinghuangia seranimata]MDI2131798.1 protein kinase [Yinghuangia seranimata]
MRVLAGRYELHELVGRGGMGEVWKGTDRELGRTIAVKVLPAELTRHEEFRQRFRREARTVAALSHQGVATLYDVGEDVGGPEPTPFLVMEFVPGRTLGDVLREGGPMPVDRAVAVARDIADTLVHSHGLGLIHRDIKPSNVMLTPSGAVKVLDFGIAKALAETTTRLTATGLMVGTPAYLSPEQIDGAAVDGRTDVYSLGCLLYELLVGRPPFAGDSPFAVMNQHLTKPPAPPSTLRAEVPGQVDAVVLYALAKTPQQRYADASALRSALESAQRAVSVAAEVPDPVPPYAQPTALAGPRPAARSVLGSFGTPVPAPATGAAMPPPSGPPTAPPAPPNQADAAPRPSVPPQGFAAPGVPSGPGNVHAAPHGYPQPEPGTAPAPAARSPWTVRFRPTEAGAAAVLGLAFLLAYINVAMQFADGTPGLVTTAEVALAASLLALLWSARLSLTIGWAYVAALSSALGFNVYSFDYGVKSHLQAASMLTLPFLGLAFFMAAGFLRRRSDPSLLVCVLWMCLSTSWWAFSDTGQVIADHRDAVFNVVVLVIVTITAGQELTSRVRGEQPVHQE